MFSDKLKAKNETSYDLVWMIRDEASLLSQDTLHELKKMHEGKHTYQYQLTGKKILA